MTGVATLPREVESQDVVIKDERIERAREPRVLFFAGDDRLSNEKNFNPEFKGWGGTYLPHIKTLKQSPNKGMLYRCRFTRITTVMQAEPAGMLSPNDRENWMTQYSRNETNALGETVSTTTKGFKQIVLQSPDEVENVHERQIVGVRNDPFLRFKPRYPEDDVNAATKVDWPNGTAGVVEITALRNKSVTEVQEAQTFFFPEWEVVALPETIRELEAQIKARIAVIPTLVSLDKQAEYHSIGQDMLRSCAEFRIGAQRYAKNIEDADREAKTKGYTVERPELVDILSAQGEIKRKDDLIIGESSATEALVREMREQRTSDSEMKLREIELRERELALRERELGIAPKEVFVSTGAYVTPTPEVITGVRTYAPSTTTTTNPALASPETSTIVTTTESAGAITTDTAAYANVFRCGRATKSGEDCTRFVKIDGEACPHHQAE